MRLLHCFGYLVLSVLATPDDAAALVLDAEQRASSASEALSSALQNYDAWCTTTVAQREYLYEAGKRDEDFLRKAELEQHRVQGTALAEVKNYEKQVEEMDGRRQDAAIHIEQQEAKFLADSEKRVANNATITQAIETLSLRGGSLLEAEKTLQSMSETGLLKFKPLYTDGSPMDVVIGTLKQLVDEIVAEEEEEAATLEKRREEYSAQVESLNEQLLHLEVMKRTFKHMAIATSANIVTYQQMWEMAADVDRADSKILTDVRALCRGAEGDRTAANRSFASLDLRLSQLRVGISQVALLRVASTKHSAMPTSERNAGRAAEAARVLRSAPGGHGWARLAKTVSTQDVAEDARLLTALDYALKKSTEDGTGCSEVMAAKAKVIAINAEFDAVFAENVTAGAELDGVKEKIQQLEHAVNQSNDFLAEMNFASTPLEEAATAAKAALNESRANLVEARSLLDAHFAETGDPAAGGVDAAIAASLRAIDELIEGDFLRQTRARNATLTTSTQGAYTEFHSKLDEYDDDEDDVGEELTESNATLLEIVGRWKDARDEVKAAEAACEEKTSLWAHRTVRTTVERTAIGAALRALRAPSLSLEQRAGAPERAGSDRAGQVAHQLPRRASALRR
jgi:hypothetical protein